MGYMVKKWPKVEKDEKIKSFSVFLGHPVILVSLIKSNKVSKFPYGPW